MNSFLRDLKDLPDPGAGDTPAFFPLTHTWGAAITVVMAAPNGRIIGEIIHGSIAYRTFLLNGYTEVKDHQR